MSSSQDQLTKKRLNRNLKRIRSRVGITEPWSPENNKVFKCPNCKDIHVVSGTTRIYYCKCVNRVRPLTQDKTIYYGNEDKIVEEFEDFLKVDVDKHIIRKKKNGRY